VALGTVFAISLAGKMINLAAFEEAVENFRILPIWLIPPAITVFLLGELGVVVLLLWGRELLLIGFILAVTLLAVFTVALISVLVRDIQTTCNCFGVKPREPVSVYDVIRNIGLIACGVWGIATLLTTRSLPPSLSWLEWGFITLTAVGIALLWLNLNDILKIIRN
jgi:hypothetical protein